ncbi:hypothetical protein [Sandaracinus amylolyticus]|uniref:DUF5666 domain-containing protein n=1 Tax=Sandaracinus amylolyticus TaxID=927083 RepID=A0A0F6W441_9BACT|nr:hypothetical protein [Sandaracinus amylolyticus]AKF06790.1 hypothetical protein DB32_003939 [Sandaracinus amylolyticus]
MLRRSFVALLALPVFASSARAQDATVTGTIERIDTAQNAIVIRAASGERTGRLSPQTLITIDGFPGDVRDLRPGQQVSAQFALTRGGATRSDVVRIDVRTR